MTLSEIAYNIKNIVEGGISGDDSNLSLSQIKHMIHYHRAQLLTKYTDSGRFISDASLSTIEAANASGTLSIGRIVGWPNNRAIKEVVLSETNQGANKIYNLPIALPSERDFYLATRFAPNENQLFAEYNGTQIRILTSDGTLYSNSTQQIIVKAVLEAPGTSPYPIPSELVGSLVESILAKEFNIYLRTSADYSNNNVDESGGKMAKPTVAAAPSANARSRRGRTR